MLDRVGLPQTWSMLLTAARKSHRVSWPEARGVGEINPHSSGVRRLPLHQPALDVSILVHVLQRQILPRQIEAAGERGGLQTRPERLKDVVWGVQITSILPQLASSYVRYQSEYLSAFSSYSLILTEEYSIVQLLRWIEVAKRRSRHIRRCLLVASSLGRLRLCTQVDVI